MKKFGTFGGVFTPSLLTILGVIMYLRMGWVVGNAGTLAIVLGIILLAHVVSVSTGLSISSIATDKKIKTGGIYYILSRSLGFPFGGAIGLTLYAATALSISLYLIGFSESILIVLKDWLNIREITTDHLRIVATIALLLIVTIAYISTSFAIKTQYIILSAIALSLVSIFLGTSEGKGFDLSVANLENAPGFAIIFGVFFPAVTGFTAGVAMSGDLKNPEKSIPWGTLLAILTGFIIYVGLAIFIYFKIPGAELLKNNNALVEFSWIPQLVIAGIWGATLSSALGGILGGPRILQSMSIDKITPRIFGKGVGKRNEPRNALLLTFFLAEAGILIGELNVIAGVVAMFYMAAYLVINLSCFLEKWASPDFRPKFKISIIIPLIGVITIFLLMIQLNLIATIVAIIIISSIFVYLTRKQLVLSSGDVWSSVWSSVVKLGLKKLDKKPKNKRNWEPNILLFSGGTDARPHLLDISKAIAGKGGMISNFDLIENPGAKTLFPKRDQALEQDDLKDGIVFHRRQECNSLYKGIEAIASTYGFSGIEPNTTLMGWARNTKDPIWFADMNKKLNALDYNVLYLDFDSDKGFGYFKKIDIWWNNINNVSELTIQIAKRIITSSDWRNAQIRILYLNDHHPSHIIESLILKQFATLRIDFPFQIINNVVERKPFYKVVKQYSADTDLIIVEIPVMKQGEEATFVQETNDFLRDMGTTLLVSASESFNESTYELLNIEHSYNRDSIQLELTPAQVAPYFFSGFRDLDYRVQQIDERISDINNLTSSAIYSSLCDVYRSFLEILKLRFEQNTDKSAKSFLSIKVELVKDIIKNNRFKPVSEIIKNALNIHLEQINALIDDVPGTIRRIYVNEELIIGKNDSEVLAQTKQKLAKTGSEKLKLLKTVRSFYNNEYLKSLSEQVLFIGISGKVINDNFIAWVNDLKENKEIDFNAKEIELEALFNSLSNHNLNLLNNISRELSNSILRASNSLDSDNTPLSQNRKISSSKRKKIRKSIYSYSQTWFSNSQLINNHLLFSVQLRLLQMKTASKITSVNQTINKEILDKTQDIIWKCDIKQETITVEYINALKKEIHLIFSRMDAVEAFKVIQSEMEADLSHLNDSIDVISQAELDHFELRQDNISPLNLFAKRITNGVIENEIFVKAKELFQTTINDARTENSRLENVLELLKFSLLNITDEKKSMKAILKKVNEQLADTSKNIEKIRVTQEIELNGIIASLKNLLTVKSIVSKADGIGTTFQKLRKKRFSDRVKSLSEKFADRLNTFMLKSIDIIEESKFQYRTKSFKNPHSAFADFSDLVSLSKKSEKKLPFYYKQLFIGKHLAQPEFLENRKSELLAVKRAIERFDGGKKGAILFTGDPLSGKTYLMQHAIYLYCPKNVIAVSAPSQGALRDTEILDNALANATGLEGNAATIIKQLRKKSTIVFEDLELWWTKTAGGSDNLVQILNLIKQFSNNHLFILECNIYFYQHIRQYLSVDNQLLETVISSPLSISQITETILNRHRSGGMKYIWRNKTEEKLNSRERSSLFRKITDQSDGNIGMALISWIGNIEEVNKNEIYFSDYENPSFPPILNPEWENMLFQILMHKKITLGRLKEVYYLENGNDVENNLNSLIRAGLVAKTSSNSFSVSAFVLPYFIKYLYKKL